MHKELIEEIKNGNLKHLDKIYLEVKPGFFSFVKGNFPSVTSQETEDIFQDSIIDLYKNIQKGTLTEIEISFTAYVVHIGKMKLIKLVDKKQKQQTSNLDEILDVSVDVPDNIEWHKVEQMVEFIFTNMDDGCKAILERYYFKKMSMNEIANELGYKNSDVVKSKKNRCINRVYENVSKMYNPKQND